MSKTRRWGLKSNLSVSDLFGYLVGWHKQEGMLDFGQRPRLVRVPVVELVGQSDQWLDEQAQEKPEESNEDRIEHGLLSKEISGLK